MDFASRKPSAIVSLWLRLQAGLGSLRMEASGMDLKAELDRLQRENEELKMRLQKLNARCEDLEDISAEHGVR